VSLCPSYPLQIVLFEGYLDWEALKEFVAENPGPVSTGVSNLSDQMEISKNCRVRQRFPVPVICLGKKLISRSGGLVEKAEMMSYHIRKAKHPTDLIKNKLTSKSLSRNQDRAWLCALNVHHIIDFMNETTKSMFGIVPLCSGEVGSRIHSEFSHNAMPFPGVESYKGFKALAKEEKYPTLRSKNEKNKFQADLKVSVDFPLLQSENYRSWNIIKLTQNYVLYLFHLLRTEEKGLLLHCISGWDRTPLWIGILRILLWAEGLIHRSLDATQITYLVLAYDWLLFGHQFAKRLKEHSEIMYCAFWLLQHLTDDLYTYANTNIPQPDRNTPRNVPLKRSRRSSSATNVKKSNLYSLSSTKPPTDKTSSVPSKKPQGRDLKQSHDFASQSAPNFDTIPINEQLPVLSGNHSDIEIDEYQSTHKNQTTFTNETKESFERKEKIREVWKIFSSVYEQVVQS